MNKLLFFSVLLLFSFSVNAQDIITKKDGEEINCKVIKVGTQEITYKKSSNPDGPDYTIYITDVFSIKYQNGEKEMFSTQMPLQATNSSISIRRKNSVFGEIGGNGMFASINYERFIYADRRHIFFALKGGMSPMGTINTVNGSVSFNIGDGNNFFEAGGCVGYFFYVNSTSSSNHDYSYFAPNIGYRRISNSGFMFKTYVTWLTAMSEKTGTDLTGNFYTYYSTNIYPFFGFGVGYSF